MGDPQTSATGLNVSTTSSSLMPAPAGFRDDQPGVVRQPIAAILSQLRRRIRGYVLLEGIALLLVVCGGLFWLTFALDWAYFQLTAMELPLWFRQAAAVSAVALLAAGVMFWIVLRYFARFRARALALVLERRFPELGMRLITAVEMAAARTGRESPLTSAMIERTIDEAARMSSTLPLESVFDRAPLRRALVAAALLVGSVGGFILVDPSAVSRWVRAYVARDAIYWSRETQLIVKAVVQPGDRVREFRDGQLKHPRGVDLVLLVESPEGTKVPAAVELDYVLDGGRGTGRLEMVKGHERQFRHTISALLDSLSLWVSGGDYVSRTPLRVEVVEPPRLDQVTLDCDYPDYTGLDRNSQGKVTQHTVEVQSSQVSLPMETAFVLHARANKPLVALRIETESRRISLSRDRATIALRSASGDVGAEQPLPAPSSGSFLTTTGSEAAIPFLLTARAEPRKAETSPTSQAAPAAKTAPEAVSLGRLPIAIPADCRMRIELEDTDGITSVEPIRLVINGIVDQPPVIQTELRGIGSSITRKATIPVSGTITDDYGIAKTEFQFRVDKNKDWRISPFRRPAVGTPKEHLLRREESDNTERFEVLPLELKVGQRLTLSVFAQDGDNLNGPHTTRSEEYVFQIVSDEELLSLLYVKEVNLRERFEKIISELEGVKKDLVDHRSRASDSAGGTGGNGTGAKPDAKSGGRDPAGDSESLGDLQTAVAVCAVRSLHQVRKNSVETASVEESFRGLLDELVNNAVHTQQMADRIGLQIVQPLHLANERDFPAADEAIGLFKLAVDARRDPVPQIDNSVRAVSTLIVRLKTALAEMQDLVKFHEAISRLQAMIKDQQQIIDSTKQEQKKKRLKELEGLK
jgi:hypothetical protein